MYSTLVALSRYFRELLGHEFFQRRGGGRKRGGTQSVNKDIGLLLMDNAIAVVLEEMV